MRWIMLIRSGIQFRIKLLRRYLIIILIGLVLVLFRQFIPTDKPFLFLFWNLFLALTPLILSTLLLEMQKENYPGISQLILLLLWLIFFPNAPYMLTDYIHLTYGDRQFFWLDFLTLSLFSVTAFITAVISLKDIAQFLKKRMGKELIQLLVFGICMLCGLGIYLGRDLRFNSWDLVVKPKEIIDLSLARLSNPMSDLYTWTAATIISFMLFAVYLLWPNRVRKQLDQ